MIKNLRSLRTQKGISQQQLASAIGTSQQSINKYENHNIEPDIQTLIAIARFFETSVDYLVGNTSINRPVENYEHYDLSDSERCIIDGYRKLGSAERICVSTLINTYNALRSE